MGDNVLEDESRATRNVFLYDAASTMDVSRKQLIYFKENGSKIDTYNQKFRHVKLFANIITMIYLHSVTERERG